MCLKKLNQQFFKAERKGPRLLGTDRSRRALHKGLINSHGAGVLPPQERNGAQSPRGPHPREAGAEAEYVRAKAFPWRLSLCDPMDCSPPGSSAWDSPGKSTGGGCHALLQRLGTGSTKPRLSPACPETDTSGPGKVLQVQGPSTSLRPELHKHRDVSSPGRGRPPGSGAPGLPLAAPPTKWPS